MEGVQQPVPLLWDSIVSRLAATVFRLATTAFRSATTALLLLVGRVSGFILLLLLGL